MNDSITVTLGGKQYRIQQLTIGQQRDLSIGVTLPQSPDPQENVRRAFERNLGIIVAALSKDHPEITMAALLEMRGSSPRERVLAVNTILEFAGLVREKDPKPGEEQAAAAAA